MNFLAQVFVSSTAISFDMPFSYAFPLGFSSDDEKLCREQIGKRVIVPFGKGNKTSVGVIENIIPADKIKNSINIKSILSFFDEERLVSEELWQLAHWIADTTLCTFYTAFKTMLPPGLAPVIQKNYMLGSTIEEEKLTDREKEVIQHALKLPRTGEVTKFFAGMTSPADRKLLKSLIEKGAVETWDSVKRHTADSSCTLVCLSQTYLNGKYEKSLTEKQTIVKNLLEELETAEINEICYMTGVTLTIVKRMIENGILTATQIESLRRVEMQQECMTADDIVLNEKQQEVFEGIQELIQQGKPCGALLYGVTGSGKTAVFIKLIDYVLKMGKTALLLIPEISLTPQAIERFSKIFSENIAVIHSALSCGQRLDEYKRIKRGQAKLVIGTRSAVFAPLENIGIIIIDEEGESSYKSQTAPRYDARDVAIKRCGFHGCPVLMASATPSIESFYYAKNKRYSLFELPERYSKNSLPTTEIVDMNETETDESKLFSKPLIEKLKENLKGGQQSILLLNRRGFHTYVSCKSCKEPVECPNCSLPLTFHAKNNRLMCHYCGYSRSSNSRCPKCGKASLFTSGIGTQKIEKALKNLLPAARLLRMDADTVTSRLSYENSFKAFADGEYDIMLGTQMIAKGLDFPNVTCVGVISIDKTLYMGDFKSYERTFSLLTQVIGRGGRADKEGTAFIQTYSPDNYVIEIAADQNYTEFYTQEIEVRKMLIYPPFCDMIEIVFSSPLESQVIAAGKAFAKLIGDYIRSHEFKVPLRALGPCECNPPRINRKYRHRIILKTKNNEIVRNMLKELIRTASRQKEFGKCSINVSINSE